jgi:farnesyl diphosphate synthase
MPLTKRQQQAHARVDELLSLYIANFDESAPQLKKAMEYALLSGGKRVRPFLVYATGEMLGADPQALDAAALSIECIHAFSLVHDDLPAMDDDDIRRGRPTCHIQFDEATAILAGDALQTLAFEILCIAPMSPADEKHRINLVKQLAAASGYQGMCGGQAMDLAATDQTIDQTQLQLLHSKKTGALLKIAISMAYTLAPNVSEESRAQLDQFADCIGLAFQVKDDILDVVSDTETLGKPQGSDEALNKSTYPSLLGLTGAQNYLVKLEQQALHALDSLPYNSGILRSFIDYNTQRNH